MPSLSLARPKMLLEIFGVFLRIGSFTLGGGYAMLPFIRREVVENRDWVEEDRFIDFLALSQSCPGAIAVNVGVLIGHHVAGTAGGIAAVLGATLPSFLAILAVSTVFYRYRELPVVLAAFKGVRPAIAGMVFATAYQLGRRTLKTRSNQAVSLASLAALLWGVHPFAVLASFGALGALLPLRRPAGGDRPG